jgi:hypothetical protein
MTHINSVIGSKCLVYLLKRICGDMIKSTNPIKNDQIHKCGVSLSADEKRVIENTKSHILGN